MTESVARLRGEQLTLGYGKYTVAENLTVEIPDGHFTAIIGPNGCGKSTLLRTLSRLMTPAHGHVWLDGEHIQHYASKEVARRIGLLAQNATTPGDITVQELVARGRYPHQPLFTRWRKEDEEAVTKAMQATGITHLADQSVDTLSGGQRQRAWIAMVLAQETAIMLLDEPTNHLDIDSLIWLENWLRRVEATVIIISHDREFLDRAVNTIWSVEDGTICRYAGNYSQFELARIEKLRAQESARRAYETQAAHLTSFIERFRAKATKARQAQSRIKMLEKLQTVEPVRAKREWRFNFLKPLRLPEHLVDGENLKIGYGDKVVLSGVSFSIRSGERIGILGVNGAGKSTLVKAIVGELTPMSGELRRGQGLEIGYFAQHQLDQLRMDETPLEHLRHLAPDAREQELRDFLGTYRFSGDFAEAKVAPMSGGEKARLALALIAWKKPNLLVLDEPTNHLDMETREALTMALSTYEGAVLLVSHDRHLLRAVTDELWLVHEGRKEVFEGDLDDYAKIVLDHRRVTAAEARAEHQADKAARNEAQPVNNKEARRLAAQERARIAELRKPLKKELEKVEREMNALSEKLKALDTQLADPAFYNGADQGKVAQTLREHGELAPKVEALEMHWLELSEKIEALGTAASA